MSVERVVVNASAARIGGGLRQLDPIVRELALARPEWEVVVVGHASGPVEPDFPDNVAVEARRSSRGPRMTYERLKVEYGRIRRLTRERSTVLLSPLNFAVFGAGPQVLMARNAKFFDRSSLPLSARENARLTLQRALAIQSIQAVERVVVPSRAMARLIAPFRAHESVTVLPHAIDVQAARTASRRPVPLYAQAWASAPGPKLLYVGSTAVQKNIPLLSATLRELRDRFEADASLAVTFSSDAPGRDVVLFKQNVDHALRKTLHFLGPVPLDDVFPLYAASDIVLFPSLVESFGLPLLEALATGTKVVVSNLAVFQELAGRFAFYHEPTDAADASRQVATALEAGRPDGVDLDVHLQTFRWAEYAARLSEIIEAAASGR